MRDRMLSGKGLVPLLFSSLIILSFAGCAEDSNILPNGESRQMNFSVTTLGWNNPDSSVQSRKGSRATPITGTSFNTSNSFDLIADQYDGSSYSTLINNEAVSFSNSIWKTSHDYYWSGNSSKTVSFYAYYPASISGSISHTAGSAPTLSYTVPDDVTSQPDILVASKANVSGNTTTSTDLPFKHIFAAVQFSVGSNGLGSGTISSISIGDVYNSGTYTFGNGWTLGPSTKTFTILQPKTILGTSGEDIYSGTYTLMMIPQTVNNATVTVTYNNGGTLTKTISGTWEAGETYNYGLSFIREYNYTGSVQSFTVPVTGTYKLEVWGAQGGGWGDHINPPGGYAGGYKKLTKGDILYIVVGGKGYDVDHYSDGTSYNGGGTGYISGYGTYGGGGATHIATRSGCLKDLSEYRSTVLVVGGGAGSNGGWAEEDIARFESGGGEVGLGSNTTYTYRINESLLGTGTTNGNTGGTQTGTGPDGIKGGFGYGGNGDSTNNANMWAGAGGGGWYGGNASGGGGVAPQTNGGGGSGYIGGVTDGQTIAGSSSMPAPSGGTETGHIGNGYARIAFVSAN